eukprot:Unigene4234_Nuclearia_a/m.12893 Unigene4234_Nuclearia_a/g.12893  ORF Unigene4234_Nuclearia_a/g.12893 Unigene4234_Nuclearia_a/m.12893 type:complete len:371 (-) Unigene4234_Nuclearia_a:3733-4845(-)
MPASKSSSSPSVAVTHRPSAWLSTFAASAFCATASSSSDSSASECSISRTTASGPSRRVRSSRYVVSSCARCWSSGRRRIGWRRTKRCVCRSRLLCTCRTTARRCSRRRCSGHHVTSPRPRSRRSHARSGVSGGGRAASLSRYVTAAARSLVAVRRSSCRSESSVACAPMSRSASAAPYACRRASSTSCARLGMPSPAPCTARRRSTSVRATRSALSLGRPSTSCAMSTCCSRTRSNATAPPSPAAGTRKKSIISGRCRCAGRPPSADMSSLRACSLAVSSTLTGSSRARAIANSSRRSTRSLCSTLAPCSCWYLWQASRNAFGILHSSRTTFISRLLRLGSVGCGSSTISGVWSYVILGKSSAVGHTPP